MVTEKGSAIDAEEVGSVWVHKTKNKKTALSIRIDGEQFIGLQPLEVDNKKKADFYILRHTGEADYSKAEIVGSAWRQDAVDGRKILSIHFNTETGAKDPLIAVTLESRGHGASSSPDMVIFRKK